MSETKPTSPNDAVEALNLVVREIDPLYRPAEFLLGYTYFSQGDADHASRVFMALVERFEGERKRIVSDLGEKWTSKSRRIWLAERLPFLQEWLQLYYDSLSFLSGGSFYFASMCWDDLKEALDERAENELIQRTRDDIIGFRVETLSKLLKSELPRIAAGRMASTKINAEAARTKLDTALNRSKLAGFDSQLWSIDFECRTRLRNARFAQLGMANVAISESDIGQYAEQLDLFPISNWLGPDVKKLQKLLQEKNWALAQQSIRRIRQLTRKPSPSEFAALLDNPEMDTWRAGFAGFVIPAFARLRQQRIELRQPLYVESVYWLAHSLLATQQAESLQKAHVRLKGLLERRLNHRAGGRQTDDWLLALSLDFEVLQRWAKAAPKSDAEFELSLHHRWFDGLERQTIDGGRSREVRAAANIACGMIERRKRTRLDENEKERWTQALYRELDFYCASLQFRPSANVHCYIAECLMDDERAEEAKLHVRQALSIAPKHQLASRLWAELNPEIPPEKTPG